MTIRALSVPRWVLRATAYVVLSLTLQVSTGTAHAQDAAIDTTHGAAVEDSAVHAEGEAVSHDAAGEQDSHAEDTGDHGHGEVPPVWLVLPFMILLVMIATGPLFYAHHWHHHYPKYAVALGLVVAAYYIFGLGTSVPVLHAIQEYVAFIALVASLFIAASGIYVKVNARGTPISNAVLLFVASAGRSLRSVTLRSFLDSCEAYRSSGRLPTSGTSGCPRRW